jgi:hypothetical protein
MNFCAEALVCQLCALAGTEQPPAAAGPPGVGDPDVEQAAAGELGPPQVPDGSGVSWDSWGHAQQPPGFQDLPPGSQGGLAVVVSVGIEDSGTATPEAGGVAGLLEEPAAEAVAEDAGGATLPSLEARLWSASRRQTGLQHWLRHELGLL